MRFFTIFTAILPSLAAAAPTASGCKNSPPHTPGTSHSYTINSPGGGGTRSYIAFIPKGYDQTKKTPLVLSFPGHGDSDCYQRDLTQLDDPFFNTDHIIVYPQGTDGKDKKSSWLGAPYANISNNDLTFTTSLLSTLESTLCIDPTRIFATGKSNGGGFVNYLACHPLSSRFAAFAPVAGAYYAGYGADGTACNPARKPLPILEMHGYNDSVAFYPGGERQGGRVLGVRAFVGDWARRNGCSGEVGEPERPRVYGGLVDVFDYGCWTRHWAVRRADHVWMATGGNRDTERYGFGPSAVNASSVVMDFFREVPALGS